MQLKDILPVSGGSKSRQEKNKMELACEKHTGKVEKRSNVYPVK
jgi:hypothetical protein